LERQRFGEFVGSRREGEKSGMKIKNFSEGVAIIELTGGEINIINNALNEVCNGIHLEGEFHTRMGCSLEEARGLLAVIHGLVSK
jgi:hypothetical protein